MHRASGYTESVFPGIGDIIRRRTAGRSSGRGMDGAHVDVQASAAVANRGYGRSDGRLLALVVSAVQFCFVERKTGMVGDRRPGRVRGANTSVRGTVAAATGRTSRNGMGGGGREHRAGLLGHLTIVENLSSVPRCNLLGFNRLMGMERVRLRGDERRSRVCG